ncbi:UDP-2,4-diacetamido-2,4,6-trideoxy-beta-L-altropyranose hydrolase [Paraglaciecola marina]|uniref:UDP-2,4-diacetamido-2,4, 6-trideoxy-beta-L-altropyranose hydrolase n=1 Tax=Paraglaciecola marina TaxID=2500157 RepID=UPI00105F13B2|nr:UDP-2,4-diacetamido-2,4,6-trideoxy-beta-L-altropyranose hydrolase [Paraglaciecola marina]
MRIVFRVEGEPRIGLGHIMRCLALAQSLTNSGHYVCFLMSKSSQSFCQNRVDWVGDILPMDIINPPNEASWVQQQCVELQADWLVLDGYQFTEGYRRALVSRHYHLAVFDDINNSGNLFADLVINGVSNGLALNYQATAPQAHLAVGRRYQVLRQEFFRLSDRSWSRRRSLTLMFGGSDTHNMTLSVLDALAKSHVSIPISVITGAAYSHLNELSEFIASSDLTVTHHHDCQNMAEELVNSRLALSAAGGSQFELLACATPAILLVVADNQKFASEEAKKQGWCQVLNYQEQTSEQLVKHCLALWGDVDTLFSMHQHAMKQAVIDGAKAVGERMSKIASSTESNL